MAAKKNYPKKPFDKNGVVLKPGDPVMSCSENHDTERVHRGKVLRIEEVHLVVVEHVEGCCPVLLPNFKSPIRTRGVARHWIRVSKDDELVKG
jgi:hypothetical protein